MDCLMQRGSERFYGKPFEGLHQSMSEAVQSVAVGHDALSLDIVKNFPDFGRRAFVMVQERNEVHDGAFKIDIVLPERVVGIDKQSLGIAVPVYAHENHDTQKFM